MISERLPRPSPLSKKYSTPHLTRKIQLKTIINYLSHQTNKNYQTQTDNLKQNFKR